MNTHFQFVWRTNLLQKLYNQTTINRPFSDFFQEITTLPLIGQYIAAEQIILDAMPKGFLMAINPNQIMIQIQLPGDYIGLLTPVRFRKWLPYGPAYILTASPI